jgi:hypothetical protein
MRCRISHVVGTADPTEDLARHGPNATELTGPGQLPGNAIGVPGRHETKLAEPFRPGKNL